MSDFWNQRYAEPGFKYGTAPNDFLVRQAARLPAGAEVLVPGDGEGRNSVWLAQQGHRVRAMDTSIVGLRKAQALAAERGVHVLAEQADLADWQPEPARADAVVLVFVHLPSALRRRAHRRLAEALRPGGWLILEAFHPAQLGRTSGGPKDVDMLVSLADVRADFAGLMDEVLADEAEAALDEGPGHQGRARVTRWVGRRTGGA